MPEIASQCRGDCAACRASRYTAGYTAAAWPYRDPYVFYDPGQVLGWYQIGADVPVTDAAAARDRARAAEAAQRQAEAYAAACAEQDRERAAAREKAERILLGWLSPAQQDSYREKRYFDVTGSDGRQWRIICQGQTGNVQRLDDRGVWVQSWCAHPRGLPDPVAWLTQAMAVAHDAAGFLKTANLYSTNHNVADQGAGEPSAACLEAAEPAEAAPAGAMAVTARTLWNAIRTGRIG
jgi:hypothetical protein